MRGENVSLHLTWLTIGEPISFLGLGAFVASSLRRSQRLRFFLSHPVIFLVNMLLRVQDASAITGVRILLSNFY